jgi:hypothetical protein
MALPFWQTRHTILLQTFLLMEGSSAEDKNFETRNILTGRRLRRARHILTETICLTYGDGVSDPAAWWRVRHTGFEPCVVGSS